MRLLLVKKFFLPAAVFFTLLGLYAYTLSRSIFPGDPTELITVIGSKGVAHPPGYPLYTMLGRLFSLLPFFDLPTKINLMSALFGAGSAAIISLIIYKLTRSAFAGAIGAILLGIQPYLWLYSVVAEVFTLHTFLLSLFILTTIEFLNKPEKVKALLSIFILALNASNHHTAVLLLPTLVFILWRKRKEAKLDWEFLIQALGVSLLALTPYFWIIFSASKSPPINWDNVINFKNLLHLFLRRDFGTTILAPSLLSFTPKTSALELFLKSVSLPTLGALPLLAGAGIYSLIKSKKNLVNLLLCWAVLATGPLFMFLSRIQIASITQRGTLLRFYMAPTLFLALLAGVGAAFVINLAPKRFKLLPILFIILILAFSFKAGFKIANQRLNNLYYIYSSALLLSLPENAIFFTTGDMSDGGLDYLQIIENKRPDVKKITLTKTVSSWYKDEIARKYPNLSQYISNDPTESLRNFCREKNFEDKIFIAGWPGAISSAADTCIGVPEGLAIALKGVDKPFNVQAYKKPQENFFNNFLMGLPGIEKEASDLRTARVRYQISEALDETGNFLMGQQDQTGAKYFYELAVKTSPYWYLSLDSLAVMDIEEGRFNDAILKERVAIKRNPDHPKAYFNLGILLKEAGDESGARRTLLKFLSFKPDPRIREFEMANRALNELR